LAVLTGNSVTIAAGAVSTTITGTFPATYFVSQPGASWATDCIVTGKSATGFTITFTIPAPAGGGTVDWVAYSTAGVSGAGGTTQLADYRTDLRYLLHDLSDSIWSLAIKDSFLNKALQRRDLDTGANRTLITFVLTAGTDTYSFATLGNQSVFDVVGIALIFTGTRVVLDQRSYTELTAQKRPWTTYRGLPEAWCRYGPSSVIFGPTPSTTYTTEWDCCVFSPPMIAASDTDPLPYPWTQPVPYYAAYLAKLNEGQGDEAADFFRQYREQVDTAMNARVGMLPTSYPQVVRI
jgi:hypothetical protein